MQVVGVNDDSKPADFGRDAFTYEVITYSEFYIAAYLQNEKSALTTTTATLTIKNPSDSIITNKSLAEGKNRIIVAGYSSYTLTISKDGFAPKTYSLSKDDLKNYKSNPLQVKFYYTTHVYKFINQNMTWEKAKAYCESLGGNLVTITSAEENNYIADNILVPNGSPVCWAGGRKIDENWKWVTNEDWLFSSWLYGQPDGNKNTCEDCLQIGYKLVHEWNDANNNSSIPFVCEWNSEAEMLKVYHTITYNANGGSGSVPSAVSIQNWTK